MVLWSAGVVWAAATAVRLTVRDGSRYAAAVFYATPLPVLAGLAVLITWRLHRAGHRQAARCVALAGVVQLAAWGLVAFRGDQPVPPEDSLRIVFWNVSRGGFGYEQVAEQVAAFDADIVTMTEADGRGQSVEFWQSACPGYSAVRLSSGMMLLVRGDAVMVEHGRVGIVCRWRIAAVTVRGVRMKVGVADFTSSPLMFRRPGMDAVGLLFERYAGEPLILAGDFNTPIDSALFAPLRRQARNAFEQSGEGFRETWPVFAPLLTLDQLWGNDRILWRRCRHLWSRRSDHRPVVAEFDVAVPGSE